MVSEKSKCPKSVLPVLARREETDLLHLSFLGVGIFFLFDKPTLRKVNRKRVKMEQPALFSMTPAGFGFISLSRERERVTLTYILTRLNAQASPRQGFFSLFPVHPETPYEKPRGAWMRTKRTHPPSFCFRLANESCTARRKDIVCQDAHDPEGGKVPAMRP